MQYDGKGIHLTSGSNADTVVWVGETQTVLYLSAPVSLYEQSHAPSRSDTCYSRSLKFPTALESTLLSPH